MLRAIDQWPSDFCSIATACTREVAPKARAGWRHVVLDGVHAQVQFARDLLVLLAGGQQRQHLTLARRERAWHQHLGLAGAVATTGLALPSS